MRSFPEPGSAFQVSTDGGIEPAWSRDGNLYYRAVNGRLMTVSVRTAGNTFHSDAPRVLFDATRYENTFSGRQTASGF